MLPSELITTEATRAATPSTTAQSGATLSGSSWLTDLLKTGISGYVAVQTVKNQNRTPVSVTTDAATRVADPNASPSYFSTPEGKRVGIIAGAVIALALVLVLLRRSR